MRDVCLVRIPSTVPVIIDGPYVYQTLAMY